MEQQNKFNDEMLRQMYQRRGYQVMHLCSEASNDRQKVMNLTFQAFGEAWRQLCTDPRAAEPSRQDEVLLECTNRLLRGTPTAHAAAEAAPQPAYQPAPELDPLFGREEPTQQPRHAQEPSLDELFGAAPAFAQQELAFAQAEPAFAPQEPEFVPPEPVFAPKAPEPAPAQPAPTVEGFGPQSQPEADDALDLTDTSGSSVGWVLLVILLVLVILGLLWAIWGVAQGILPLPHLDLGYQWFNNNIYPLF